jgi:hypothetical protein
VTIFIFIFFKIFKPGLDWNGLRNFRRNRRKFLSPLQSKPSLNFQKKKKIKMIEVNIKLRPDINTNYLEVDSYRVYRFIEKIKQKGFFRKFNLSPYQPTKVR